MTKILAICLAKVAFKLIYKDQTGFIWNTSILNQVYLTKLIVNYMEATKENGIIIVLDQEKTDNKIQHEYLFKVLRQMSVLI